VQHIFLKILKNANILRYCSIFSPKSEVGENMLQFCMTIAQKSENNENALHFCNTIDRISDRIENTRILATHSPENPTTAKMSCIFATRPKIRNRQNRQHEAAPCTGFPQNRHTPSQQQKGR